MVEPPIAARYRGIASPEHADALGLARREPWPHWILDDFLDPGLLGAWRAEILAVSPAMLTQAGDPQAVQYALLEHLPLARVFYAPAFRALLQSVTALPLMLNQDTLVQLRRMDDTSPAFPPHIDDLERRSLVAVFYLSAGWRPGRGGELCLYRDPESPPDVRVEPLDNRLFLFFSDAVCWHGICPVQGWERLTVLSEWLVQPSR